MDQEFSYHHFVNCLLKGDHREFYYQDKIVVITSYPKRVEVCVENNGTIELRQSFTSVQEFLLSFRVDNMTLEELWNKIDLA